MNTHAYERSENKSRRTKERSGKTCFEQRPMLWRYFMLFLECSPCADVTIIYLSFTLPLRPPVVFRFSGFWGFRGLYKLIRVVASPFLLLALSFNDRVRSFLRVFRSAAPPPFPSESRGDQVKSSSGSSYSGTKPAVFSCYLLYM